jgi:hypothetical protein
VLLFTLLRIVSMAKLIAISLSMFMAISMMTLSW